MNDAGRARRPGIATVLAQRRPPGYSFEPGPSATAVERKAEHAMPAAFWLLMALLVAAAILYVLPFILLFLLTDEEWEWLEKHFPRLMEEPAKMMLAGLACFAFAVILFALIQT